MNNKNFLVIGATGHVGSKITILLADRGYNVTAMVRQTCTKIRDPYSGPEWLTWGKIAAIIAKKVGRKKVRVIPMPAGTARLLQLII